jgi:hypothetical protein
MSGALLHSALAAVGIANPIIIAIALNMSRMTYLHDKRSCGVLGRARFPFRRAKVDLPLMARRVYIKSSG